MERLFSEEFPYWESRNRMDTAYLPGMTGLMDSHDVPIPVRQTSDWCASCDLVNL